MFGLHNSLPVGLLQPQPLARGQYEFMTTLWLVNMVFVESFLFSRGVHYPFNFNIMLQFSNINFTDTLGSIQFLLKLCVKILQPDLPGCKTVAYLFHTSDPCDIGLSKESIAILPGLVNRSS